MRSTSVSSVVTLAALLLAIIAAPAAAQETSAPGFSCKASAVRVNLLGGKIEPIVANPHDAPCADDSKGLVGPLAIGPVTVSGVATARTDSSPGGAHAESAVTRAGIGIGPGITADVLTSRADVGCVNGQPSFSTAGEVVALRIGGTLIAIPPGGGPLTVPIPLVGTLYLNEVVTGPGRVTRRALRLDTLLVDVVIAESTVNVEGNPCGATPPPPPQCSDGIDNDGDDLVDAKDPGCLSGPGGKYNPDDNDEAK